MRDNLIRMFKSFFQIFLLPTLVFLTSCPGGDKKDDNTALLLLLGNKTASTTTPLTCSTVATSGTTLANPIVGGCNYSGSGQPKCIDYGSGWNSTQANNDCTSWQTFWASMGAPGTWSYGAACSSSNHVGTALFPNVGWGGAAPVGSSVIALRYYSPTSTSTSAKASADSLYQALGTGSCQFTTSF